MCMEGSGLNRMAVLILLAVFLCVSCSTQKHFRLLSFFFDGVPSAEEPSAAAAQDKEEAGESESGLIAYAESKKYFDHQPYMDRDCSSCHLDDDKGLRGEDLMCQGCHKGRSDSFLHEHGPWGGGFCITCHEPHRSEYEGLLKLPGNELCFSCHGAEYGKESIFHQLREEQSCTACHGPHGGQNFSLLDSRDCFLCHEDPGRTHNYLHGPVAAGFCTSCHLTHNSESEYNLVLQGTGLCTSCHEMDQLVSRETHEDLDGFICRDCHHPHGGEDKNLLE